jgi:hypothetical protein
MKIMRGKMQVALRACLVAAFVFALSGPSRAEHCWAYVDGAFSSAAVTKAPFECRRQGNTANPCRWLSGGSTCHLDGDLSDCCTSIPNPSERQTILDMHTEWHGCFGNTGGVNPPPGRSARWLAFHRQFEFDFDLFREATFPCSPLNALGDGCFIESLDWHRNMVFPYGHFGAGLAAGAHPDNCGTGPNRPDNIVCSSCRPLPACLYTTGTGPINGDPPTPGCPDFPAFASTRLENIPTLEDVAKILDSSHHGNFHGEVGVPFEGSCTSDADCLVHVGGSCSPGFCPVCQDSNCVFNTDVLNPSCSPRDPMFWRLHKRLDDTVRAWQEKRPFDVTVVIDRSGSMSETDASGKKKIEVATEALRMFADLVPNALTSRVGVVSYSTGASADLGLTSAASAAAAVAPVATALEASVGGCTSIGSGLESAVAQLCNGSSTRPASLGKTSCHPDHGHVAAAAEAERKAIVLLTDGMENRAPCLNSVGGATPSCGGQCGGGQFDFDLLGPHTQLCAVGFGQAGSLNSSLLTLVAERQGGIYMQSPAKGASDQDGISGMGRWVDLKDFFVKCLGQVSDEFVGLDPKGFLPTTQVASEPMIYSTCDDEKLTFVGGWDTPEFPGDLRVLVNTPSGALVQATDPTVEASNRETWSFVRVKLPFKGELAGDWRAQLVRRQVVIANGFTTDSLPLDVSVPLVRRQIQRICPDGCSAVLYFEDGHLGPKSSYSDALEAEQASGLLSSVTIAADPNDFLNKLVSQSWQLIVYAHQMSDQPEPYDARLARLLCDSQPAVVTETRGINDPQSLPFLINLCAGSAPTGSENWNVLTGDQRLLDGSHMLTNHGYARFSYGLRRPTFAGVEAQAISNSSDKDAAILAVESPQQLLVERPAENLEVPQHLLDRPEENFMATSLAVFDEGSPQIAQTGGRSPQNWFMNVLVRGASKLDDAPMRATLRTGESGLLPSVRVLPANIPQGGYDEAVVQVEIDRPIAGLGRTLTNIGQQPPPHPSPFEDVRDGRSAALALSTPIPTAKQTYLLNDDGVNGDLHAKNGQWSTLRSKTPAGQATAWSTACIGCTSQPISRKTLAPHAVSSCAPRSWTWASTRKPAISRSRRWRAACGWIYVHRIAVATHPVGAAASRAVRLRSVTASRKTSWITGMAATRSTSGPLPTPRVVSSTGSENHSMSPARA